MDVHQWHSNTPMYETPKEDKIYNKYYLKFLRIILMLVQLVYMNYIQDYHYIYVI